MKLIFVTLFLGESRLAAVVQGEDGKQRRIELRWMSADATDLPPPTWLDTVRAEVDHRITEEKKPNMMGFLR